MYPVIILAGGSSKARDGLPDQCKRACIFAVTLLEEVARQLGEGDITIEELEKFQGHIEQMKLLYEAAAQSNPSMQFTVLNYTMKQRLEEFQVFQDQLGNLQHLCHVIPHRIAG